MRRNDPPVHRGARLVTLFETLSARLRDEQPVALATVIDGPHVGGKLLVTPDHAPEGSLGHPELDRVVARDT
ncbi:MAG TPA: XdhC family protein, partial [Ilumatobacteraceae bacterium]